MGQTHIRAKFRCLGITEKMDGIFIIDLKPVMKNKGGNHEENQKFWEASPNGECELVYSEKHPIEVGAYYFIDMILNEKDEAPEKWTLSQVHHHGQGSGSVYLDYYLNRDWNLPRPDGLQSGKIRIGIDGKHTEALRMYGSPDSKWRVEFSFAEKSDDQGHRGK